MKFAFKGIFRSWKEYALNFIGTMYIFDQAPTDLQRLQSSRNVLIFWMDMSYNKFVKIKFCRYGYAVQNEFKLHNSIMKFDFNDPSQTKSYELEDGEFGTEPVFVENPEGNGEVEDDGWVVVQTLNSR